MNSLITITQLGQQYYQNTFEKALGLLYGDPLGAKSFPYCMYSCDLSFHSDIYTTNHLESAIQYRPAMNSYVYILIEGAQYINTWIFIYMFICVYGCMCVCVYVNLCIYIYRERYTYFIYTYIYIYIFINIYIFTVYIYIEGTL